MRSRAACSVRTRLAAERCAPVTVAAAPPSLVRRAASSEAVTDDGFVPRATRHPDAGSGRHLTDHRATTETVHALLRIVRSSMRRPTTVPAVQPSSASPAPPDWSALDDPLALRLAVASHRELLSTNLLHCLHAVAQVSRSMVTSQGQKKPKLEPAARFLHKLGADVQATLAQCCRQAAAELLTGGLLGVGSAAADLETALVTAAAALSQISAGGNTVHRPLLQVLMECLAALKPIEGAEQASWGASVGSAPDAACAEAFRASGMALSTLRSVSAPSFPPPVATHSGVLASPEPLGEESALPVTRPLAEASAPHSLSWMQKPAAVAVEAPEETGFRALPLSSSAPGASTASTSLEAACRLALVNLARISAHRSQSVVSWHLYGGTSSTVSASLLSTARDLQYALAEAFPDRVLSPFGGTYEHGPAAAVEPAARLLQFSCAAVLDPRAAAAAMEGMPYHSASRAAREMVRVVAELLRAPATEAQGPAASAAPSSALRGGGTDAAPRVGSAPEASLADLPHAPTTTRAKRPPLAAKERLGIRLTGLEPDLVARDLFMHFSQFGDVVRASVSLTLGPGSASSMTAAVHFTELDGVAQSLAHSPHTIKGRSVAATAFTGRTERAAPEAGAQSDAATDSSAAADGGGGVPPAPMRGAGAAAATTAPAEGAASSAAAAHEAGPVLAPSGAAASSIAEAPASSPSAPEAEERFFLRLRGLPPSLTAADVKSRFGAYGAIGRVKVSSAIGTSSEHDGLVSFTSLDTSALGALGRQVVLRGYPVSMQLALSPAQHQRVREERSAAKAAAAAVAKETSAREQPLEPVQPVEPPVTRTAAGVSQAGGTPTSMESDRLERVPGALPSKLQLPSLVLYGTDALPSNASMRQYFGHFGEVVKFKRWDGSGGGGGGRKLLGFVHFADVQARERALAGGRHVIEGVAFSAERGRPPPLVIVGSGAVDSAARPAVPPAGAAPVTGVAADLLQTTVTSRSSTETPPGTSSNAAKVSPAPLAAVEAAAAHASEASAGVAAPSHKAAAHSGRLGIDFAPLPAPPLQTTLPTAETSTAVTSLAPTPRAATATQRPAAAATAAPQRIKAHAAPLVAAPPHPVAVPDKARHAPTVTPRPVLATPHPVPADVWRAASHEVAAELQRLAAAPLGDCSTAKESGRTTPDAQLAAAGALAHLAARYRGAFIQAMELSERRYARMLTEDSTASAAAIVGSLSALAAAGVHLPAELVTLTLDIRLLDATPASDAPVAGRRELLRVHCAAIGLLSRLSVVRADAAAPTARPLSATAPTPRTQLWVAVAAADAAHLDALLSRGSLPPITHRSSLEPSAVAPAALALGHRSPPSHVLLGNWAQPAVVPATRPGTLAAPDTPAVPASRLASVPSIALGAEAELAALQREWQRLLLVHSSQVRTWLRAHARHGLIDGEDVSAAPADALALHDLRRSSAALCLQSAQAAADSCRAEGVSTVASPAPTRLNLLAVEAAETWCRVNDALGFNFAPRTTADRRLQPLGSLADAAVASSHASALVRAFSLLQQASRSAPAPAASNGGSGQRGPQEVLLSQLETVASASSLAVVSAAKLVSQLQPAHLAIAPASTAAKADAEHTAVSAQAAAVHHFATLLDAASAVFRLAEGLTRAPDVLAAAPHSDAGTSVASTPRLAGDATSAAIVARERALLRVLSMLRERAAGLRSRLLSQLPRLLAAIPPGEWGGSASFIQTSLDRLGCSVPQERRQQTVGAGTHAAAVAPRVATAQADSAGPHNSAAAKVVSLEPESVAADAVSPATRLVGDAPAIAPTASVGVAASTTAAPTVLRTAAAEGGTVAAPCLSQPSTDEARVTAPPAASPAGIMSPATLSPPETSPRVSGAATVQTVASTAEAASASAVANVGAATDGGGSPVSAPVAVAAAEEEEVTHPARRPSEVASAKPTNRSAGPRRADRPADPWDLLDAALSGRSAAATVRAIPSEARTQAESLMAAAEAAMARPEVGRTGVLPRPEYEAMQRFLDDQRGVGLAALLEAASPDAVRGRGVSVIPHLPVNARLHRWADYLSTRHLPPSLLHGATARRRAALAEEGVNGAFAAEAASDAGSASSPLHPLWVPRLSDVVAATERRLSSNGDGKSANAAPGASAPAAPGVAGASAGYDSDDTGASAAGSPRRAAAQRVLREMQRETHERLEAIWSKVTPSRPQDRARSGWIEPPLVVRAPVALMQHYAYASGLGSSDDSASDDSARDDSASDGSASDGSASSGTDSWRLGDATTWSDEAVSSASDSDSEADAQTPDSHSNSASTPARSSSGPRRQLPVRMRGGARLGPSHDSSSEESDDDVARSPLTTAREGNPATPPRGATRNTRSGATPATAAETSAQAVRADTFAAFRRAGVISKGQRSGGQLDDRLQ